MEGPAPRQGSGVRFGETTMGEVAGLKVYVDTLRFLPSNPDSEGEAPRPAGAWLVGFSGQTSAVRGAWANLIGGANLRVGEEDYRLAQGSDGWRSFSTRLDPKASGNEQNGGGRVRQVISIMHIIMLPPCADTAPQDALGDLLVVDREGQDPAMSLVRLLHRRSAMPVHPAWSQAIWNWAKDAGCRTELEGFGPRAWLIRTSDDELLKELPAILPGTQLAA